MLTIAAGVKLQSSTRPFSEQTSFYTVGLPNSSMQWQAGPSAIGPGSGGSTLMPTHLELAKASGVGTGRACDVRC